MSTIEAVQPPPEQSSIGALHQLGQSIWLDGIRRSMIRNGELRQLVEEGSIHGAASNPLTIQAAIANSPDYDLAIAALESEQDREAIALYRALAIQDARVVADIFRPLYHQSCRVDGYVSLAVSPYVANDAEQTLIAARKLWRAVDRPNLMVNIPATPTGISVIQKLVSEGINVGATLLFSVETYRQVARAYLRGLEIFADSGGNISQVAGTAAFSFNRIDTAIDRLILKHQKDDFKESDSKIILLKSLEGQTAIANNRLAYQAYLEMCKSDRWQALFAKGAMPQRLLWASTGSRNSFYSDALYIEELVGDRTVHAVSLETLSDFRSSGEARARHSLTEEIDVAEEIIACLPELMISFKAVADRLLEEAIERNQKAFDCLLGTIERKREATLGRALNRQVYSLPSGLYSEVQAGLIHWQSSGRVRQLWEKDATLWTGRDEDKWLGWLGMPEEQEMDALFFNKLSVDIQKADISAVVLLCTGASALCLEAIRHLCEGAENCIDLYVLDSIDPQQISGLKEKIDIAQTLFIESCKHGDAWETSLLKEYFFDQLEQAIDYEASSRFVAITDPGSKLQRAAQQEGFRRLFLSSPNISDRYAALSTTGMVPAAYMGLDVASFTNAAERAMNACSAFVPATDNPGVILGLILGVAAKRGKNKLTLVISPGIERLGAWIEQLLASSTGKEGRGIIPIDQEPIGEPDAYGSDRTFVYIRLDTHPNESQDRLVAQLVEMNRPVVQIRMHSRHLLGQEFFRWEMAAVVAASVLGVHAFEQPDVAESAISAQQIVAAYELTGELPPEVPLLEENGIKLFTSEFHAAALRGIAGRECSLSCYLQAQTQLLREGDYFALLAYLPMEDSYWRILQDIRRTVRDQLAARLTHPKQVATYLGWGPRYLHAAGQVQKGGPNTGVFLQITCDDAVDISIPGKPYSFGVVKAAQARGDFQALLSRKRRALRVHIGADIEAGLLALRSTLENAIG